MFDVSPFIHERSSLRLPPIAEEPRLHLRGRAHACSRHRGEHGDLPTPGCNPPACSARENAAGACSGPDGGYDRRAWKFQQRLPSSYKSALGAHPGHSAGIFGPARLERRQLQPRDERGATVRPRSLGEWGFFQGARHSTCLRPRLYDRRRSTRQRPGRGNHQFCVLATGVRG